MSNPEKSHSFRPEMGGQPDTTKLFYSPCCYVIRWAPARDEEVSALLRKLKIRPSRIREFHPEDLTPDQDGKYSCFGGHYFEAGLTSKAYEKVQPWCSNLVLLD